MQEKKDNPLKEMIINYRRKLEAMSPEERAKEEAKQEQMKKMFLWLLNDSLDDFVEPETKK